MEGEKQLKVWLVSLFEPTPIDDSRPMRYMGIANELINNGNAVTVWTGSFFHHTKSHRVPKDETLRKSDLYKIKFIKGFGYKKNVSFQRFFSHFYTSYWIWRNMKSEEDPDIVLLAMPPISILYFVSLHCRKRKIPLVVDIIDPWPDVFYQILPKRIAFIGKIIFSFSNYILKSSLSKAQAIISISNTYIKWAKTKLNKEKILSRVFYPSVDLVSIQNKLSLIPSSSDGKFRAIYAGGLSDSYDVETIIKCARLFQDKQELNIEFIIAGSGPNENSLKKIAKNLNNIVFTGWLNQDELLKYYSMSDVGIACYRKGATQTITYKLFDYLSAGLPFITSLKGETEKLVQNNNFGLFYEPGDEVQLFEILKELSSNKKKVLEMKESAIQFTSLYGSNSVVYNNLMKFLIHIHNSYSKKTLI